MADSLGPTTTWHNGWVPERRYFDTTQPQTLQGGVMLSYINVAFALLWLLTGGLFWPIFLVQLAGGAGAFGIANENRLGYRVCVGAALVILALTIYLFVFGSVGFLAILLNLLFAVVLVALLLHPQSREYQRIWFR